MEKSPDNGRAIVAALRELGFDLDAEQAAVGPGAVPLSFQVPATDVRIVKPNLLEERPMADRPTSEPASFRELMESLSSPVPIIDPADWDKFSVFRETFVSIWLDKEDAPVFRAFGRTQSSMACEQHGVRHDTELEYMALDLVAALADLRVLQGFFDSLYKFNKPGSNEQVSPREKRWLRLAQRLSKHFSRLGDEMEKELAIGLQESDE
ncbi:MAG TPA: hypothetical protein VH394_09155 [Thermoanaerobaculia bacterium]|nr:hypothetical protein [Thermoanaerobaculia bacterium]